MTCARSWSPSRFAVLALSLSAGALGGCSSDVEVGSCAAFCDQMCARMKECGVGDTTDTCASSCRQELSSGDQCPSQGVSEIACEELSRVVRCATYCPKLCEKAATCQEGFDSQACVSGCIAHGTTCNQASIDVRDCDHIAGETECYVLQGQQKSGGSPVLCGGGALGDKGSLCGSMSECANGLGCSKTTGTCQPCQSHDDCQNSISTYFCTTEGKCVYADCLTDDDCADSSLGSLCRVGKCVKCGSDADCPGGKCSEYDGCVQCIQDTDCASDSMCDYGRCWKRCSDDAECGNGGCFVDHCTAAVGTPCDANGSSYGQCGGAECINVDGANQTVDGYCSRSCYSTDSPCPDGFTCHDSECRKQ